MNPQERQVEEPGKAGVMPRPWSALLQTWTRTALPIWDRRTTEWVTIITTETGWNSSNSLRFFSFSSVFFFSLHHLYFFFTPLYFFSLFSVWPPSGSQCHLTQPLIAPEHPHPRYQHFQKQNSKFFLLKAFQSISSIFTPFILRPLAQLIAQLILRVLRREGQ